MVFGHAAAADNVALPFAVLMLANIWSSFVSPVGGGCVSGDADVRSIGVSTGFLYLSRVGDGASRQVSAGASDPSSAMMAVQVGRT